MYPGLPMATSLVPSDDDALLPALRRAARLLRPGRAGILGRVDVARNVVPIADRSDQINAVR